MTAERLEFQTFISKQNQLTFSWTVGSKLWRVGAFCRFCMGAGSFLKTGQGGIMEMIAFSPHTMEPLKELDLDTPEANKLALRLHDHSVQYT
eukprot:775076-Pelagomonas_calceolata.AAC.1